MLNKKDRKKEELDRINSNKENIYITGIKYNTDFVVIDYDYWDKTLKFYDIGNEKVYTAKITKIKRGENKKITAKKTNCLLNQNFLPPKSQKYLQKYLKECQKC